eukprot:Em0024g431a
MASLPIGRSLEPFDPQTEDFEAYAERLEQYLLVNDVSDKKMQVLRDLLAPDTPASRTLEELLETSTAWRERSAIHGRASKVGKNMSYWAISKRRIKEPVAERALEISQAMETVEKGAKGFKEEHQDSKRQETETAAINVLPQNVGEPIRFEYGQDALMAKIDLKAAFRLIPVQAADWVHLGICWRGQFYVDTCLPFGLRSAPALFNHYAEALDWIMANNYGAQLLHYLDDFLLVGPPGKDTCQEAMSRMLTVCDQLGIPVASEKLEGPTTALTFLGIVLDTSAQQLRLPPDKLEELTALIRSWLSRHKATKWELLSLIGKLSFAAKLGSFTITSALMQKQEPTLGGEPSTNPNPTSPARDLNHHLQLLLNRAMAPSTATTYATGIRRYQGFCHTFKLIPVPGTNETITLFAAHLSWTLNSRTIQRLEAAPLKRHDRRMLRAALTLGFFGFLKVSEFTLKNRRAGRPLTSKSFRSTFLSLVEQCGYNPAQYNTHSLRIGAATAAARAGLPTETIQKLEMAKFCISDLHLSSPDSPI